MLRGGVLLEYGDPAGVARLGFLPADVALRVAALSARREVPGLRPPAIGIALADGEVVTVIEVGRAVTTPRPYQPGDEWAVPGNDRAIVCGVAGQRLALTGGTIVATGVFEAAIGDDGIQWQDEVVPVLDVRALYRAAEAAIWEDRARAGRALAPGAAP